MAGSDTNWELLPWPDFGHIEGIETELFCICFIRLHNLHIGGPLDLLALLNSLPQLTFRVVRVFTTDADGLWPSQLLLSMFCDEVVLDVDKLTLCVDPLECVTAIAMLVNPPIWRTVVREKHQSSMVAFS